MTPFSTTPPIIQGSTNVGAEIVLPTPIKSKKQIRRKIIGKYIKMEYQWLSNGVPILGAKDSSYTPSQYEKNVTCHAKYLLPRHRRQYRVRRWVIPEILVFWDELNMFPRIEKNYI
jgi:hypothetical protein